MPARYALIPLLLAALLAACAPAASVAPEPLYEEMDAYEAEVAGGAPYAEAPTTAPAAERAADSTVNKAAGDRIVIKNATLSVVVTDPATSVDEIAKMAESMGGYVVTSNVYQTTVYTGLEQAAERVNYGSITIRVPAERLTEAMERIKQGAGEVSNENISGTDVTQEYTDLQSRLRNLQAAEAQLKEIMASANKTEDVLNVFNQLVYVQEQIEVIKGQIQYYEQSAAFSSISVELTPDAATRPIEVGPWRPEGTVKEALAALIESLQDVANAAIWVALYVVPLGLLFGLPVYFFVRWIFFRRRRAQSAPPASTTA